MSITNEQIAELRKVETLGGRGQWLVRAAGPDATRTEAQILADAINALPDLLTELTRLRTEVVEARGRGDAWREKFHADTKELERLTLERDSWKAEAEMERESNERLRAAVDAAGGICVCGHVRDAHNAAGAICWTPQISGSYCKCSGFAPATQPGEGEGER